MSAVGSRAGRHRADAGLWGGRAGAGAAESDWERPYKDVVSTFERDYLERAIAHFGSVGEAAKRLGLDRTTIFRKLKRAGGE